MKEAKQNIIQVQYKSQLHYVSIVQKQNDSGILFNDRIFFLLPQRHIGYISQVKIDEPPSKINFQKSKVNIPLQQIKSIIQNDRSVHIKLIQTDGQRKLQKDWNLRMSTPDLAKKWHEKLNRAKIIDSVKKSPQKSKQEPIPEKKPIEDKKPIEEKKPVEEKKPIEDKKPIVETKPIEEKKPIQEKKLTQQPILVKKKEPTVSQTPKKQLQIIRSQSFTYNAVPEIEKIQKGVGMSPAPSQPSQSNFKNNAEKKEIGTAMSNKAQSIKSQNAKNNAEKKEIGTAMSNKAQSIISQKKSVAKQQPLPKQTNNKPKSISQKRQNPVQKSTIINKISKQAEKQDYTDRSAAQPEPQKNKSVRSQPSNRKMEPFDFKRNKSKIDVKKYDQQPINKQDSKLIQKRQEPIHQNSSPKQQNEEDSFERFYDKGHSHHSDMIQLNNQIYTKNNISSQTVIKQSQVSSKVSGSKSNFPSNYLLLQESIVRQPKKQPKDLSLSNKRYISDDEYLNLNTSSPMNNYNTPISEEAKSSQQILKQLKSSRQRTDTLQNEKSADRKSPKNQKVNSILKSQMEQVKQQSQDNKSQDLHKIIQQQFSSIHLKQQKSSLIDKQLSLPWTYKYVQYGENMFAQYKSFCMQLFMQLIQNSRLPAYNQAYKPVQIEDNIYRYQIDDIQVKIAFINIEAAKIQNQSRMKQKICNKNGIKNLQNQYKNFQLLYQHLDPKSRLKVPLVCLCQINGSIGLFKILSKFLEKPIRIRQIDNEINSLKQKTKINNDLSLNHKKNIIQLNQDYYNKFNTDNTKQSFNRFFIQEIQEYLLIDGFKQEEKASKHLLFRKQLIQQYANRDKVDVQLKGRAISHLYSKINSAAEDMTKNFKKSLNQVILQIDSLDKYFFNSKHLSEYLHSKGVNIRYLGYIYQNLNTAFQKRVIISEIAARSCKSLFRKTLQDIMIQQQSISPQAITLKICDFLNCVVSNSFQTAAIWKVLSSHSMAYYGVQISSDQIQKGYFLISLVQNCRLNVVWQKIHPQNIFLQSIYFTQRNLIGLIYSSKIYRPYHSENYHQCQKILSQPHSEGKIGQLVNYVDPESDHYQAYKHLQHDIKSYLSYFISPYQAKQELRSFQLYAATDKQGPSKGFFNSMLMQIKWFLKFKDRQNYIKKCDQFIRYATKYYGQFHPIFSQLYDLFSSFHLGNLEFEDSITFAKSSLVNILKVCGMTHQKTSQCYYNLALCYIKSNKKQDAFSHMKKAKQIFETNQKTDTIAYAVINLKLALIYLNQDETQQCLKCCQISLKIFEKQNLNLYEDEVIDCYQMIIRCSEIRHEKQKIDQISLKCSNQIQQLNNRHNIQRGLKIIIYPFLSQISAENASIYIDLISQINLQNKEQLSNKAYQYLQIRIKQQSLMKNLQDYILNILQIQKYLRKMNLMQNWISFKEIYARQTINDFISLTQELILFLGQGFILGSLRQAL